MIVAVHGLLLAPGMLLAKFVDRLVIFLQPTLDHCSVTKVSYIVTRRKRFTISESILQRKRNDANEAQLRDGKDPSVGAFSLYREKRRAVPYNTLAEHSPMGMKCWRLDF